MQLLICHIDFCPFTPCTRVIVTTYIHAPWGRAGVTLVRAVIQLLATSVYRTVSVAFYVWTRWQSASLEVVVGVRLSVASLKMDALPLASTSADRLLRQNYNSMSLSAVGQRCTADLWRTGALHLSSIAMPWETESILSIGGSRRGLGANPRNSVYLTTRVVFRGLCIWVPFWKWNVILILKEDFLLIFEHILKMYIYNVHTFHRRSP